MDNQVNAQVATADTESVIPSNVTDETVQTNAPNDAPTDTDDSVKHDEGFVPFPKKAVNAISRRDKEIAKLRAQVREMQQKSSNNNTASTTQPKANEAPQEKDFETYGEYLEAKTLHKLRQEIAESKKAEQETRSNETKTVERTRYVEQKSQGIAAKAQEYTKNLPDFQQIIGESIDLVDGFPEAIQDLFLEAPDAALAFYNLAKEGTLADLADMTPTQASMAIALAHKAPTQKTTQAPRPMRGASGTGQSAASLSSLEKNPDALMKWLKS